MPEAAGRPGGTEGPLGVLACAGPLPIEVAVAAERQGRSVHIVAVDGYADESVAQFPHERVNLGQLGRMLSSFTRAGVRELVIAGAIQRPDLLALKPDMGFLRHLPTVLSLQRGGDDRVLRRIVGFFERQGFIVRGAAEVAPELLSPSGALGRTEPTPAQETALARAAALIGALGRFDVGQGVVATPDRIVAVEGVRGTDAMLRSIGPDGVLASAGPDAVLVKLAKPDQEMRVDLPTVGRETLRLAESAGLTGIGIGAGAAIVLQRAELVEAADAAGLFVEGIDGVVLSGGHAASGEHAEDAPAGGWLEVVSRRLPTPRERRDVAIGQLVMGVLRAQGAGHAALVSREHVLAVSGALPPTEFVRQQQRGVSWRSRLTRGRRGVLILDGKSLQRAPLASPHLLDDGLRDEIRKARLKGLAILGPLSDPEERADIVAWARREDMFVLLGEENA